MKNKLFNIANMPKYGYINRALSKISKLALVGYNSTSAYSPLRAFFMRNISMRSHVYGEAGGTLSSVQVPVSLSTNPFQLCHPHLVVNGKASKPS
jgi:hypothetical protein